VPLAVSKGVLILAGVLDIKVFLRLEGLWSMAKLTDRICPSLWKDDRRSRNASLTKCGDGCGGAGGVSGLDLDELLVNVTRELLLGFRRHVLGHQACCGEGCEEGESEHSRLLHNREIYQISRRVPMIE